jgi:hypothetical protein
VTIRRRGDAERPTRAWRHGGVHWRHVDRRGERIDGGRQPVAVVGDGGVEGHAVDGNPGCADEVCEQVALAASRECGVEQRRGIGAAAHVGIGDGRRMVIRPGERDLPGAEPPVGVRDRRLRLLAREPAEFRAADADARQDAAVVLLAPCVQDSGADADGEQDAQDERDAEAEGERPSAPRRCRGLAVGRGGCEGQDRHGINAGLGGLRRVRPGGVGWLVRCRRIGGARISRGGLSGWRSGCAGIGRHQGRLVGIGRGRVRHGRVRDGLGCGIAGVGARFGRLGRLVGGRGRSEGRRTGSRRGGDRRGHGPQPEVHEGGQLGVTGGRLDVGC